MRKRRITIMLGSGSDLAQCLAGLSYLEQLRVAGKVEVQVIIVSLHRNTDLVLSEIRELTHSADVAVVGAGWANHLTGTVDAYLRYTLRNTKVVVVGVAFADYKNSTHTAAARLSITEVPGTNVVFDNYVGSEGFFNACRFAAVGNFPAINLPDPKPAQHYTLTDAIKTANLLINS